MRERGLDAGLVPPFLYLWPLPDAITTGFGALLWSITGGRPVRRPDWRPPRQARGARGDEFAAGNPVGHGARSYGSGLRTGSEIVDYDSVVHEPSPSTPSATPRGRCTTPRSARRSCRSASSTPGGPEIFLKLEMLQPIGSFKIRGAYNAVRRLTPEQLAEGVWTVSAGNAAQGVALAARKAGARCSVMVMDTAPETKLGAIERLGATIVKASYDECWQTVETHGSPRMTGHFVHPFDDDDFISGNGTAGLEIVEDLPDVDAVVARDRRRRAARRHRRRAARAAAARRRSTRPSPRPRRRSSARWTPARPAASTSGRRRSSTAPAASPSSTRCGRCSASTCTSRSSSRSTRRRGRCGSSPSARASSPKAPAPAPSPPPSRRRMAARGHKKVVAVVSGGNVDLAIRAARRRVPPSPKP